MNIHEYQAKEVLAKFGVPVRAGLAGLTAGRAAAYPPSSHKSIDPTPHNRT